MTYGSKQNQHIISRGLLGDAAKQIGTWSYVLMHTEDDGREFSNKQWEIPLVIRANKRASRVLPYIDKHNQRITAPTSLVSGKLPNIDTDTEIETVWPIVDEVRESLDIHRIEKFCKQYILFTTDISFKFLLIDNSIRRSSKTKNKNNSVNIKSKKEFLSELAQVITSPAPKAPIKIDAPTFHSISTTWNNKSTIHSYTPEEFTIAFTTVHDKENTTVHDVLLAFKEGTQLSKTPDTEISVMQLMKHPRKEKKIESLFHRLRKILKPVERLSLPYSHIKPVERKKALINRILSLYPGRDHFNTDKAVYRLVHGSYEDERVWGTLYYPFAFEIIAIPLSNKILRRDPNRPSGFIGGVNYSVSPRSNRFEGEYRWFDKKSDYFKAANDIEGILEKCGFEFGEYSGPRVKLPCVIAANLVSARIDYKGKSKSDIDTQPFSNFIIEAVTKVASEIQTFRAAGFEFYDERELREFKDPKNRTQAMTVEDVLEEVLRTRKEEFNL